MISISPDGAYVAISLVDVIVYDYANGEVLYQTTGGKASRRGAWLEGGKVLAVSEDRIEQIDAKTWKPNGRSVPTTSGKGVRYSHKWCLALPDGRLLTPKGIYKPQ